MPAGRPCPTPTCPAITTGGRCPTCRADHERTRGRRQARGYDTQHDKTRARLLPQAIGKPCPRCQQPMLPSQALDLGHSTPLRTDPHSRGDRIEHATCNRAARDQ